MRALVVAAHPDDEVLGCGGTIHGLVREKGEVDLILMGSGGRNIPALAEATHKAGVILGFKLLGQCVFKDNGFDLVGVRDLASFIEALVKEKAPYDLILTHYWGDLNVDHQLTCRAVMTAFRPQDGRSLRIEAFEVPSSTGWYVPDHGFEPTVYRALSEGDYQAKRQALDAYSIEMRKYPHPRSITAVMTGAQHRGTEVSLMAAEAFKLIREVQGV